MVLEKVNENVLKLSGDVSLSDVYSQFPEKELFVEPLSSQKPLSEFISSGGFGYGALREGPLNSKIFRIKWQRPRYSFRYGLMDSTLNAAGYPLYRMTSALPHKLYDRSLGEISEVVIPVRDREDVKVVYQPGESADFHVAPMTRSVLLVNDRAASLVGLPGQGSVSVYPLDAPTESDGEDAGEFLQKRFIEDNLNGEQVTRVLTQKSSAAKLHELAGQDNVFVALSINIGWLVMVSGDGIKEQLAEMPLTYSI
ncbi:hypothetical protein ACFL6S_02735 [Candidatus Poribacteria bacterium]